MKKLRESVIAKLTAWVLCVVSIMGCAVLGIFIVVGVTEDLFYKTRDDMLKRVYESVNEHYSMQAIRNLGNSTYAKTLGEEGFKYGIIKSDSLRGINFQDKLSYVETNMTAEELKSIDADRLFLYQVIENSKHPYIGSAWGYYGDYGDISALDASSGNLRDDYSMEWTSLYADRICYDVKKGILYYRADGKYYPVQNVSLRYNGSEGRTIYNYNYDFINKGYKLNYKSIGEGTEWAEVPEKHAEMAGEVEISELQTAQDEDVQEDAAKGAVSSIDTDMIEEILNGSYGVGSIVNLAKLNGTDFNYTNWGTLLLDNIRYIDGGELTLIDSENFSEGYFINKPGYYLDENYTLIVAENIQTDTYWVASIVPEPAANTLAGGRYDETGWLVNLYYDIVDKNIFQGFGISLFVTVASFCFLAYALGHRRGEEGIVLTPVDRIPLEVLTGLVGAAEVILLLGASIVTSESGIWRSAYAFMGLFGLIGVLMTVIGVGYMLSLCVRIKAGKWWRNSLVYWIYSRIRSTVVYIFRNVDLLWKAVIIIAVVSFAEFYVLASFHRSSMVMLWLVEKLVLCVAVFVLIIQMNELQKASRHMAEGNLSYKVNTDKMFWECRKHGENLNKISEGMAKAVDERMKSERFRTELITNVSHDIKTPLTSIINYVDLLEKEELHNEKAAEYLEVLDRQSSKLKKLIEDLVEASKASSGSLPVDSQKMEVGVFVTQTVGEFEEKLAFAGLELIVSKTEEPVYIMADGRHIWRVIDNLMNNICKYAQTGSRVYVNLEATEKSVSLTFRNISKYPLNISGEELMERFVRGDKSRNTEGHGLGLSIAQSLMKLIDGDMNIVVDGDLFKVVLTFSRYQPDMREFLMADKEDREGFV